IDPRMRRGGAIVDAHHIGAILGKAAIAVPEAEVVACRSRTLHRWLDSRAAFFRPALNGDGRKTGGTKPLARSLPATGGLGIARGEIDGDFLAAAQLFGQRAVLCVHDDTRRSEQRVVAFVAHLVAAHREDMRLAAATRPESF